MPPEKQNVVISIRLDDLSLKAVDLLVEAGLETNRSRAVSHLINVGIQSSEELLKKAQQLANRVHQLRNEMVDAVKINNLDRVTELLRSRCNTCECEQQQGGDSGSNGCLLPCQ